ncbi:MAG: hypothetical protein ACKO0M_09495 [Cyanobium sp.]
MALDPRSRERLEALGRSLPKPLPVPEPARPARSEASAPRHAVETEQDPEQLFRELMAASADGNVPPHLLDRLRLLEQERLRARPVAAPRASDPPGPGTPDTGVPRPPSRQRQERGRPPGRGSRPPSPGSEEAELYSAFAQLLLEDDELD